ncbi:MAG: hypothetical protein KAI66_13505 [Lentisphaeria bacterium]|nr:hypothetical protein [Lentisphaeria bacterium]
MKNWPQKHRNLVTYAIFVLLVFAACWVLFVRPMKKELEKVRDDWEKRQTRLLREGWPLNPGKLEALRESYRARLDGKGSDAGIKARSDAVALRSSSMFDERIRTSFGTRGDFMKAVSRLDYQTQFNRVFRELAKEDVLLAPDELKLSEDSSSPYVYQLVLQVWTLEMVVRHALDQGLKVAAAETAKVRVGNRDVPAAKVTVLPVRAYYAQAKDADPYVLEMPVRMTVSGGVDQCRAFLRQLTSEGTFLPISHLQLYADDPSRPEYERRGSVKIDKVRMEVECSAFFLFKRTG